MSASQEIVLLGAGAMARALGAELSAGSRSIAVWARRPERARELVAELAVPENGDGRAAPRVITDLTDLAQAPTLLLCVSDSAIASLASAVAEACPAGPQVAAVALHTAGALSSLELEPLRRAGWAVGSLHPLVSIPPKPPPGTLRGAPWAIEGDAPAREQARAILLDLGGEELLLHEGPAAKLRYHAGASLLAGGATALLDAALEILDGAAVDRDAARRALVHLGIGALRNARERGTPASLSGPAARGDAQLVERHLAQMQADGEGAYALYRLLLQRMLRLADEDARPGAEGRARIARLLDGMD